MTRVPFAALVAALTGLAALMAAAVKPGRADVVIGATLGTGVAGLFAAVAVAVLARIKAGGDRDATARLARAFSGLMLGRMVGYLAVVVGSVALGMVDLVSVCAGLVGGTLVFQTLEILYLRKVT